MATNTQPLINLTEPPELEFGDRLRVLRRTLDKNQKQMALLIDVKPSALGNWETNRSQPRAKEMLRIARLLEKENLCPADWLLGVRIGSIWRVLTSTDGPLGPSGLPKARLAPVR